MMENLLEQANSAARQGNWILLNQCLRQIIESEKSTKEKKAIDFNQLLDWALEILAGGDFQERWDVAKIFPSLGNIAIAPLISILKDEEAEEELRWFVGRILGEFDRPEVISALVETLKSSESEELSAMAAAALANMGQSAIAALTELLAEEETRLLAVRSLSAIRRSEIIIPLLSVVSDSQVAVRATAIEALSSFHDPRIPPILLQALKDVAAPVRREAVIGLGLRTDLEAQLDLAQQIVPLLRDFNIDVCHAAACTLARLKTNAAADALYEVLRSPATPLSLSLQCVRSLAWMETPEALAYLQQALDLDSAAIYQEIVTVLGQIKNPNLAFQATKILIDALKSEHPANRNTSARQALAMSLGELGLTAAIDSLIYLLEDADVGVRLHAIAALKKFPSALGQLQELALGENLKPELKQGVAFALQEF